MSLSRDEATQCDTREASARSTLYLRVACTRIRTLRLTLPTIRLGHAASAWLYAPSSKEVIASMASGESVPSALLRCARILRITVPLALLVVFPAAANEKSRNGPQSPDRNGEPDVDFAERCAAPGVVYCNGFDSAEDLAGGTVGLNCNDANKASLSSGHKASGDSSLMFEFTAGVSCSNIAGNWQYTHPDGFGAGDDLYVQYRFRASPEYFSNNEDFWQSTVKQMNIHGVGSSCQNTETTHILYQRSMQFYHTCAGIGLVADLYNGRFLPRCDQGACLVNQGSKLRKGPNAGYNCDSGYPRAGKGNGVGCFWPSPNKWYTIYIHYDLNSQGGNDNGYYAWESHDGGPYLQYLNIDGDGPWAEGGSTKYQNFWLETYMTELREPARSTAYLWYDEFIISRQPIRAPKH